MKTEYIAPEIEKVVLDHEISLALQSAGDEFESSPWGPDELSYTPEHNPFNLDNLV